MAFFVVDMLVGDIAGDPPVLYLAIWSNPKLAIAKAKASWEYRREATAPRKKRNFPLLAGGELLQPAFECFFLSGS